MNDSSSPKDSYFLGEGHVLSTQKPVDLINEPNAYFRLQRLPERNLLRLPNA